jgi:uncharacterized lipoprotein YbaY
MPSPALIAHGEIRFEAGAPGFEHAVLRVYLEDATEADAPARVVATEQTTGVSRAFGASETIPFAVHAEGPLDPSRSYYLRVHIDVRGTGSVGKGDFVTTQSYPISPSRLPAELRVLVRWVRP